MVAGLVLAVAACGGSSHHASAPPTTTGTSTPPTSTPPTSPTTAPGGPVTSAAGGSVSTTTAPSVTTAPAAPQACRTAALQLALTNPMGTAGSTYVTLSLLNQGPTCTLEGYPGVSFVAGPAGTQVGAAGARSSGTTAALVTLAPGHAAQATLRLVDPGDFDPAACRPVATTGLRVYPPGETAAGFVADPGQACSSTTLPQPTLFVGPVVAGPADGGIGG